MVETLPCSKIDALRVLKNDVAAIIEGLDRVEIPSLPFPDIENILPKALKAGIILDIEDLFALGIWAKSYNQFFSSLRTLLNIPAQGMKKSNDATVNLTDDPWSCIMEEEQWANFGIERIIGVAPSLHNIANTIFAILTPEGELRDLPRIRSIRASLQKVQTENHRLLSRYLTDPSLQDALQSNIATERDNRTVIAIKANFRGRIKGIVHEFSSSGQTVFIEPLELVERNNKLFELEMKLAEEIRSILKETLAELRPQLPALSSGRVFLALADVRLARAFQAKRSDLVIPPTLETGIHLYQAKHPLLGN
jgi:DNA mismatch repair protein MutS2